VIDKFKIVNVKFLEDSAYKNIIIKIGSFLYEFFKKLKCHRSFEIRRIRLLQYRPKIRMTKKPLLEVAPTTLVVILLL